MKQTTYAAKKHDSRNVIAVGGLGLMLALAAWHGKATSQTQAAGQAPQKVLNFSSAGEVEVPQDYLQITLTTNASANSAQQVQKELQHALDAALEKIKPEAAPAKLEVQTGNFSVYPRYNSKSAIESWTGRAELLVKGEDFPHILAAIGKAPTMTIGEVNYGLKPETLKEARQKAQLLAIENFQQQAQTLSKAFGFNGYTIREVSVGGHENFFMPRAEMASAKSLGISSDAASAAVPQLEAGKVTVTINVNGAVQMHD